MIRLKFFSEKKTNEKKYTKSSLVKLQRAEVNQSTNSNYEFLKNKKKDYNMTT